MKQEVGSGFRASWNLHQVVRFWAPGWAIGLEGAWRGDRFSGLAWMGVSYYRGFSPGWAIGLEGAWRGDRFSGLAWMGVSLVIIIKVSGKDAR